MKALFNIFPQILPDIMSIVSKWQSLSKNDKKDDEVQKGLEKLKAEDVKFQEHGKGLYLLFYLLCLIVLILIK